MAIDGLKMPFTGGLPETACGAGSTLEFTKQLRVGLANMLRDLAVKTVVDAPCGDFNWMACVAMPDVYYFGIDFDEKHILLAKSQPHQAKAVCFKLGDATAVLPRCDARICRDFLQHLGNADAAKTIVNFYLSGSTWLLATSFDNETNAEIDASGFRPLNLTKPPFNLPNPVAYIPDGKGRILGLWRREPA